MHIKKNDTVKVIAGKDRGKTGKVLRVLPEESRVVVEGVALLAKHIRPGQGGQKGQKVYFPSKLNVAKVMLMCPGCSTATRVSFSFSGEGKAQRKERVCKKCKNVIAAA